MAKSRVIESSLPDSLAAIKAEVSRRLNSESLDGERSNPHNSGGAPAQGAQEQSNPPDGRDNGSSRERKEEAGSLEGARGLSTQPEDRANPFLLAGPGGPILQILADRFNSARSESKVGAWRQLQTDLMNACPFLVPGIIPLKDLLNLVADIEKEIKGSNQQAGRSNEELLAEFLSGKDSISISVSPNAEIESELGD